MCAWAVGWVVADRDPRPPLGKDGGVHAHTYGGMRRVKGTEDGRRSPLHRAVGGCVETGAELKGVNEPVRFLYDAVKPKLSYACDRCADAYLRTPT